MWFNRVVEKSLLSAVDSRPVVLLTGARQTGKCSLLQKAFSQYKYVTLDNLQLAVQAKENPDYFLNQFSQPVILDEIQYAPELFRYIKIRVDRDRSTYGQWLLTGSQKFEWMQSVGDSLAGRIRIIHLETLSALEIRQKNSVNLNDYIWKGGYPELWSNPRLNAQDFFEDYIPTYIERDLRQIINISNLVDFQRFIRICASRIGQLINYRDIANDVGVSDVTIKSWLGALEQSGLIYRLPPFYANIGKRFVKSSKLYFADHGLAAYLLGIPDYPAWQNHIYKGNLWENIVFCELVKTGQYKPGHNLFFYRDQNGVEMDFLIQDSVTETSAITLIEAKASENISPKKLNFSKIAPLFKKRPVRCLLMANISENILLKMKQYDLLNPVLTSLPLSGAE